MEYRKYQCDIEDASMCIKEEPEVLNETHDSANCSSENMDEAEDSNNDISKNGRRSKRERVKSNRYRSEDDNIITLSPEDLRRNGKYGDRDLLVKKSSSSSRRETCFKNNDMPKSRCRPENNLLREVLKQIGLHDELYDYMKSKGITGEALKYMQTRHIDELFKGKCLGTKIIFEHRLNGWQSKIKNYEERTSQLTYNNINNQVEEKLLQLNSSMSQILLEADFASLSTVLTNAVQQTIESVLKEFRQSHQKNIKDKFNDTELNKEVPVQTIHVKNIKIEPNDCTNDDSDSPDKLLKKIARQTSNKLVKVADEILLSNKTVDISITPQSKRRKMDSEMNVQEILTSFSAGQHLLDEYGKTGLMTANQRTELVRCIVDFYIRKKMVISFARCKELADEIVELFPTECVETYFIQDSKHRPPKGKIWDRYQSRKRSIRKLIDLNSHQETSKNDPSQSDMDESFAKTDWSDMQAMCSQMKHMKDEKILLEKWKESFTFRRHQLQTGSFINWKLYFDEYPFCKQQNYAQFIESDLETLYPNLKFNDFLWDEFIKNFPMIFLNHIKHPKSKLLYDQLIAMENLRNSADYVAIKIIELLHAVLKTHTNKLQSIPDAQRKFTVEVRDLSDLKKVVIERKKYYTENNIQVKPYIAVVGQNRNYSHFSVILDSTGFSCDNYKDSLILCFNLYLFFDISFPHESLNVWTFIQTYFFNKPPLISNPRVETFINDIKNRKLVSVDIKTNLNGIK